MPVAGSAVGYGLSLFCLSGSRIDTPASSQSPKIYKLIGDFKWDVSLNGALC